MISHLLRRKVFFILIISSLLFANKSFTQEYGTQAIDAKVQWTFKEKMKLSIEQILRGVELSDSEQEMLKSLKLLNGETNITNSSDVEAEIHAAINPTDSNNIVISPIRQNILAGDIYCPIYYTHDFGETWKKSFFRNMPHEAGKISGGGGDPVLAFDADGKLYYSWIDLYGSQLSFLSGKVKMGIFWAWSDDGGETWIKPTRDTILLGEMNMMMGIPTNISSPISDKQWMAVDQTNSQYRNNLYVSYVTISQNGNAVSYQIKCKTKSAGVNYFSTEANVTSTSVFSFAQFSSLGVDNLGNVHVIFYGTNDFGNSYGIFHSVSTDGGSSFSDPNKISDVEMSLFMIDQQNYDSIPGINKQRIYPSPYIGTDMNTGGVFVTWTAFGLDSDAGSGLDIYFSGSTDNGTSWTTPYIVNDDNGDSHNFYSSIHVKENSEIVLSWYDRRDDPGNINTHYYYSISDDGGASFGENIAVSDYPTDFSTIGSNNQDFGIGEYTQVLASGCYTIPVWCDGRSNDGNLNVFISFIDECTNGITVIQVSEDFSVGDIFPNPASGLTNVEVRLNKPSIIHVRLVGISGKIVKEEHDEVYPAGNHLVKIDVADIAPGKYLCQFIFDTGTITKSILIDN